MVWVPLTYLNMTSGRLHSNMNKFQYEKGLLKVKKMTPDKLNKHK